tara:strand:+ start:2318 stop:3472 length:1155 start_codon:yes stop_codon:yes gene_type:complete
MFRPVHICFFALLALGAVNSAQASTCEEVTRWPTDSWEDATEEAREKNADVIAELEELVFTLEGEDAERIGTRTDAVVIIKSGRLIYEKYARGWNADKPHLTWSVTKSITSALTGLAVSLGVLSLETSICDYYADLPPDNCAVTVKHLLEFSTGFDWTEVYENEGNQVSSVFAMLYGEGREDMSTFVANHPLRDEPGTTYQYSTGDATLLTGILTKSLSDEYGDDFAWDLLFDPLGMTSSVIERDRAGGLIGGSYFYATPRDLARFGYLYLNNGCWENEQMLPEEWVTNSTSLTEVMSKERIDADPDWIQGWMWWLNITDDDKGLEAPWPDLPATAFGASGHWGQSINVFPTLDMVVVRTADDRDRSFVKNDFLKLAVKIGEGL